MSENEVCHGARSQQIFVNQTDSFKYKMKTFIAAPEVPGEARACTFYPFNSFEEG